MLEEYVDGLCVLEEYVDGVYAGFDTCGYHRFTATHFNARLHVKSRQSQSSGKSRSRALGHNVCLKSMLRKITMKGMILAAITASEKCTLMLDST